MICVVAGPWLGVSLAPLAAKKSVANVQLQRCALLRSMLDAVVAHLFLHTYNQAAENTEANLGRAISLGSLRDLVLRYVSGKTHNRGEKGRESDNLKLKDGKRHEEYKKKWDIDRVQKYIERVELVAKGYRDRVKESEYKLDYSLCFPHVSFVML